MKLTDLERRRHDKFIEIINKLNEQHRHAEVNVFDCGELGMVRVWFHGSWQHEWLMPSKEFVS